MKGGQLFYLLEAGCEQRRLAAGEREGEVELGRTEKRKAGQTCAKLHAQHTDLILVVSDVTSDSLWFVNVYRMCFRRVHIRKACAMYIRGYVLKFYTCTALS